MPRIAIALVGSGMAMAQAPLQLLHSSRTLEQTWGAYLAGKEPQFHDTLIDALRLAASLKDAPADTEKWVYAEALLDALIQQGGFVPEDALLPFALNWRDPVLILLARGPGSEETLLGLRAEEQNMAEWVAVNNLLFRLRSQRFFRKTLEELKPSHVFEVRDREGYSAGCGGASGRGEGKRQFPAGYPPVALYQLDVEQLSPWQDALVAVEGPTNVYYRRVEVPTGKSVLWSSLSFFDNGGFYREQYLAVLAGLGITEMEKLIHAVTGIVWQSSDQVSAEIEGHLGRQSGAIRDFVARAQGAGLGNVDGVCLKIDVQVQDLRKQTHTGIEKVPVREIVFERSGGW